MLIMSKILTGAAGLAMVAGFAAPAAAQSYPYSGYGNSNGNVVGQLLNQVIGGGSYGQYGQGNDRVAVDQCARAAQARVSQAGFGGYNQGYNGQGYGNNGYNYAGAAQVVGITSVERKSNGLKVSGVMSSGINRGAYGNQGYNQGYGNQGADLRFSCRVDYRGYVSNIDIKRMNPVYRRGY
jgi:hypothetical protein